MPCLAVVLALISPRLAIIATALFSDILSRSMDSWLLPLIGFFVLPWTTLAYAVTWDLGVGGVRGIDWFFVVLAFLADIGVLGGVAKRRD